MKITFKKIRYKNFLSAGNHFTELDLTKHKTTLISGSNGSGKSSAFDSLYFALFNVPWRKINKPQLINSINGKELLVEVEFDTGGSKYLVRRGIKPTVFEIFRDGKLIDQNAAKKDYQEYLEKNILGMNKKSFTQVVMMGSATYVPFMDLTPAARREIIEDLLDIQVFSTMNTLVKERVSSNKEELKDNEHDVSMLRLQIKAFNDKLAALSEQKTAEVEKIKVKSKELVTKLDERSATKDLLESELDALAASIEHKKDVKAGQDKLKSTLVEISTRIKTIRADVAFYTDHDNCPTCKQGISHELKTTSTTEKLKKIKELELIYVQLESKIAEQDRLLNEISKVEDEIREKTLEVSTIRSEITFIKSSLSDLRKELLTEQEEAPDTAELKVLEEQLKSAEEEREQLIQSRELLAIAAVLLKDTGIKSSIIKQFVPLMNKLINKYLGLFDLFVDFQLDENFNETIKSRFRDTFSYSSFSEGEKMRINLSILMTWRAISKLRNSVSTNLLIMDEVLDSGTDEAGVNALLQIINETDIGENIFIISHRGDSIADKFDGHIQFEKIKGFSEYSIIA